MMEKHTVKTVQICCQTVVAMAWPQNKELN